MRKTMSEERVARLQEFRPPVQAKLSALWTAVMFCYVYGDFFSFFMPGRLARMNAGNMDPLGAATPLLLLGIAVAMAIPSLMVFLALVLPAAINRFANIIIALTHAVLMPVTMIGAPLFYVFLGLVEMCLTLTIAAYAWRWPCSTD